MIDTFAKVFMFTVGFLALSALLGIAGKAAFGA